jgi:hypothetical protein
MKWFGKAYGAAYEYDSPRVDTPVGEHCAWCDEAMAEIDTGVIMFFIETDVSVAPRQVPYHYECHMRRLIGGVNHQLHLCFCPGCAGVLPPDPTSMTRREAASAAVDHWHKAHR